MPVLEGGVSEGSGVERLSAQKTWGSFWEGVTFERGVERCEERCSRLQEQPRKPVELMELGARVCLRIVFSSSNQVDTSYQLLKFGDFS